MSPARVLVVEDDQIVATDIKETVAGLGYEVCGVVSTGEDSIRLAEAETPDAILMDIRLAGEMDGIAAAEIIHKRYDIPVLYLTAHSDRATLDRAKVTEPYGYILKPFVGIELQVALEIAIYRKHKDRNQLPQLSEEVQQKASAVFPFLKTVQLFERVPDEALRRFAAACRTETYRAGDLILVEGDEQGVSNFAGFIVRSGRIAMLKTSLSGRELIVELLPPGDPFAMLVGLEKNVYPLTARAQTTSEVVFVPRSAFLGLITELPDLYRGFVEEITRRLRESHNVSRALAHDRVEVRIASALTKLSTDFGSQSENDCPEIPITRQELADLTGTTVETAIRTTKALEKSGLLDLSRVGIIRLRQPSELYRMADA